MTFVDFIKVPKCQFILTIFIGDIVKKLYVWCSMFTPSYNVYKLQLVWRTNTKKKKKKLSK